MKVPSSVPLDDGLRDGVAVEFSCNVPEAVFPSVFKVSDSESSPQYFENEFVPSAKNSICNQNPNPPKSTILII